MTPEKTKYLYETYPGLYGIGDKTPMYFGFSCGDGWFDIINELSAKLEPMGVRAFQVKEKFGTLRFYAINCSDEAWAAIDEAEHRSETTCEACGSPGTLRGGSWLRTSCDQCEQARHSAAGGAS